MSGVVGGVLYKRTPPPPQDQPQDDEDLPLPPPPSTPWMEDCVVTPPLSAPGLSLPATGGKDLVPTSQPFWGHFDMDEELESIDFSDRDDIYQDDDDCNFYNPALGYATYALDHYNAQDMNKIKYELVEALTSGGVIDDERAYYVHVNFTAKSTLHNSKEELFFAELYLAEDRDVFVPTCIVSLEGQESVGGIRGVEGVYNDKENILVYNRLCHACPEYVKHPKDGTLCEAGHRKAGLLCPLLWLIGGLYACVLLRFVWVFLQ